MLLFYVRHGDPTYNPDALTPLGHRQAEAASHRLAQFGLDRIFASSSTRAIQTAQPTCEILKKEPVILDWCKESHAWSELTTLNERGNRTWLFQHEKTVELLNSNEIRALGKEWYTHPAFQESSCEAGIKRIQKETDAWLAELGYVHLPEQNCYRAERPSDIRVALFAHQGFGLAFLSCVLDIPYPMFATHADMGHTGITVIEFAENKNGIVIPRMLQLSNDSHIYRNGLPTDYQNRIRF